MPSSPAALRGFNLPMALNFITGDLLVEQCHETVIDDCHHQSQVSATRGPGGALVCCFSKLGAPKRASRARCQCNADPVPRLNLRQSL